jgi:SAM-dependent methyltransferase
MNCDRIARWYRWLEYATCGRALERRRLRYLDAVTDAKRVLMLGEGDGRFLGAFVQRSQQSSVDSVEISLEMMRLAKCRAENGGRVVFHCADARLFSFPEGAYDLIATHFFLDCFSTEDSAALITRIAYAAAPKAEWLISEFHQPANGLAHYWTGILIRACYFGFRLTTGLETKRLPEYREALKANGFRRMRAELASGGLLISELWERDLTPAPIGGLA